MDSEAGKVTKRADAFFFSSQDPRDGFLSMVRKLDREFSGAKHIPERLSAIAEQSHTSLPSLYMEVEEALRSLHNVPTEGGGTKSDSVAIRALLTALREGDLERLFVRAELKEYLQDPATPLYTRTELSQALKETADWLRRQEESLLGFGYPQTRLVRWDWCATRLGRLWPFKEACLEPARTPLTDTGELPHALAWVRESDGFSPDPSMPLPPATCSYEEAPRLRGFDDALCQRLTQLRPCLLKMKTELLTHLAQALSCPDDRDGLWGEALDIIARELTSDDLRLLLSAEERYAQLRPALEADPYTDVYPALARSPRIVHHYAGLADLLHVVGHCEEELKSGVFDDTRRQWAELDCRARSASYYESLGKKPLTRLDTVLDRFEQRECDYSRYWESFCDRLRAWSDGQFQDAPLPECSARWLQGAVQPDVVVRSPGQRLLDMPLPAAVVQALSGSGRVQRAAEGERRVDARATGADASPAPEPAAADAEASATNSGDVGSRPGEAPQPPASQSDTRQPAHNAILTTLQKMEDCIQSIITAVAASATEGEGCAGTIEKAAREYDKLFDSLPGLGFVVPESFRKWQSVRAEGVGSREFRVRARAALEAIRTALEQERQLAQRTSEQGGMPSGEEGSAAKLLPAWSASHMKKVICGALNWTRRIWRDRLADGTVHRESQQRFKLDLRKISTEQLSRVEAQAQRTKRKPRGRPAKKGSRPER